MKSKKDTGVTPHNIRVSQGAYQKALFKSVAVNLVLALVGLVLVYLCFAATVARVVPSSAGFVPLKNNTYAGGILPATAQALILLGEEKVKYGMLDRLTQSFVPQEPAAIVSIAAGPVAREVKWTGGVLTVDGKAMPAPIAQDPGLEVLADQYIAVCITGDCTPGTLVFFTPEQILGIPFAQDAAVPAAPPIQNNTNGPDRNNADEVVRAFVIESYYGNAKLSCSLLEPAYLKKTGGQEACASEARQFGEFLGREFDFTTGLITKVVSDDGKNAVVEYSLKKDGADLGTVQLGLVKTGAGWAINSETDK